MAIRYSTRRGDGKCAWCSVTATRRQYITEIAQSLGTERFLREIRMEAALSQPHILRLFDSGQVDEASYYVMRDFTWEVQHAMEGMRCPRVRR